jgi:chromosome segregation ATPase
MEGNMWNKIIYILGGLLLCIAFAALAGMGYWIISLNRQLQNAQAHIQATEANYDQLKSNHDELNADFDQAKVDFDAQSKKAKTDLEQAQAQITKLEAELKASQEQGKKSQEKLDKLSLQIDVLDALFSNFSSVSIRKRVQNTNDAELLAKFEAMDSATDETAFQDALADFLDYLVYEMAATVK